MKVLMQEVTGIDLPNRIIHMTDKQVTYDYLVMAMGARTGYFGNEHWERNSLPLKL